MMKRHVFAPGTEPTVLTATSCECSGGNCEKCPGTFNLEEYGKEPIFCIHDCHNVRNARAA